MIKWVSPLMVFISVSSIIAGFYCTYQRNEKIISCVIFCNHTVVLDFASKSFLFFRPDPGETILRILKDAIIDVENMKNENLLPADGKKKMRDISNIILCFRMSRGVCN